MTELSCLRLGRAFPVLILMAEIMALPHMDLSPSSDCTVLHIGVKRKSYSLVEAKLRHVPNIMQSNLAETVPAT